MRRTARATRTVGAAVAARRGRRAARPAVRRRARTIWFDELQLGREEGQEEEGLDDEY